jgi:L-threonylcarbamoyladenylate synthase
MRSLLPITDETIARAAHALRSGDLVAFPTETVYGLGADATNDTAVAKIFAAKSRPSFNPLIVHVADAESARRHVEFSPLADKLAALFWPGAVSFILPRRDDSPLSLLVSAGLSTVAIRVPAHSAARQLLRAADLPVAAPSANRSGRISPTTATHVDADLGAQVALILDGGACSLGVESTVIDLTVSPPALLRPGGVTQEAVEAALDTPLAIPTSEPKSPKSPGMLLSHYAPRLPVRLNTSSANSGEALLGFGTSLKADLNLSETRNLTEAAANLFAFLHQLDDRRWTGIAIMPIPEKGLGRAINDRLRRAAAPRV